MIRTVGVILLSAFILFLASGTPINEENGFDDIEGRIFNGQNASLGNFPYQCFLEITRKGNTNPDIICGCVIISQSWVLTAAHCVYNISGVRVSAGMVDVLLRFQKPAQVITADKWVYHPDYKGPSTFNDDIAAVHLPTPFTFNQYISRAFLPPKSSKGNKWDNTRVVLSGWGNTGSNGGWLEDVSRGFYLKYTITTVLPYTECVRKIGSVPPKDICSNRMIKNSGICQGDSGGPLAFKVNNTMTFVLGITSFLVGKCGDPYPGGFVNVNEYLDWVQMTTGVTDG